MLIYIRAASVSSSRTLDDKLTKNRLCCPMNKKLNLKFKFIEWPWAFIVENCVVLV